MPDDLSRSASRPTLPKRATIKTGPPTSGPYRGMRQAVIRRRTSVVSGFSRTGARRETTSCPCVDCALRWSALRWNFWHAAALGNEPGQEINGEINRQPVGDRDRCPAGAVHLVEPGAVICEKRDHLDDFGLRAAVEGNGHVHRRVACRRHDVDV